MVAATVAVVVGLPGTASAHPLGNFTVNRYSGVVVSSDAITVDHVLDLAEIPTAQRTPAIDTDGDGSLSRAELGAWATAAVPRRRPLAPADGRRPARGPVGPDARARGPRPGRPAWRRCGWTAGCAPRR